MTTTATLEIEFSVSYTKDQPVHSSWNATPVPDGKELVDMKVYLNGQNITNALNKSQLEDIESQILESL